MESSSTEKTCSPIPPLADDTVVEVKEPEETTYEKMKTTAVSLSEGRYVAATPSHINLAAFQSGVVGTIGDDVVTNEGVAETPKRITIAGSQSGVGGTSRDVGLERAKIVAGGSSYQGRDPDGRSGVQHMGAAEGQPSEAWAAWTHPQTIMPLIGAGLGGLLLGISFVVFCRLPAPAQKPAETLRDLASTVLTTVGWIGTREREQCLSVCLCPRQFALISPLSAGLYYIFLFMEAHTANRMWVRAAVIAKRHGVQPKKLSEFKYFNAGGWQTLSAKRTVVNMIEQAFPIMLSLWMHAVFVDARRAGRLGWTYISFRALYPYAFNLMRKTKGMSIFASTFPGYAMILLLIWPVVFSAYTLDDTHLCERVGQCVA